MGVEYERSAVENAAQKTGLPVTMLADVRSSGLRFDIIHLGDVLEHLPAPRETMQELRGLLAPGGSSLSRVRFRATPASCTTSRAGSRR